MRILQKTKTDKRFDKNDKTNYTVDLISEDREPVALEVSFKQKKNLT